jgi:flagellar biosynthetic protein FliR
VTVQSLLNALPAYVLVFFRVAAAMVFAPLVGSVRIPRAVRAMLAMVLAAGLAPCVPPPVRWPNDTFELMGGIAGEILFGFAMGMAMNFVFIAVQWAGEIIAQQMGLSLAAVFDPSTGQQGTVMSDLYFMMTLTIFLVLGGHHALLIGVWKSFDALPLLSVNVDSHVFDLMVRLLHACTLLAFQLAAPVLVTMLVVDLALGFVGKTMPQINVMSAGISMRGLVSMVVVVFGLTLTSSVIGKALERSMNTIISTWSTVHT